MNKINCEKLIQHLNEDQRSDLLMHLAEFFNYRIINESGTDITYFISTDGKISER